MRRFLSFLFFLFVVVSTFGITRADDNVVIDKQTNKFVLKQQNGRLSEVRVSEVSEFLATRADDNALAVTFYGEGVEINKAKAPDSRPVYRAWQDDDLFYTGSRVCVLPLKLKKGKPVEAVFERTYKEPEQFCQIMLTSPYYTRRATYTVTVPPELAGQIVLTPKNLPVDAEIQRVARPNGEVVYSLELTDIEPYRSEPLSAASDCSAPQILVGGYFADIDSLYDFLRLRVDEDERSDAVRALAVSLCEGKTDDLAKIDTIASWVRNNIRYVAVEHGEYGLRPDAAESVLSKRYGDCKGSANLIRAMLRSVGIDGRLAWVGTRGDVPGKWTDIVSLAAGNHQIAAAVVGDSVIFIDGTVQFAPRGLIPGTIAGQQCLLLNGERCRIETIPEGLNSHSRINATARLRLDDGALSGAYTTVFSGEMRMSLLGAVNGVSAPKRKAALQALLSFERNGITPDSIELTFGALDDATATVTHTESDKAAVKKLATGKTYVQLRPLRAALFPTVDARNRKFDILYRHPYDVKSVFSFSIPDEYTVESVPDKVEIKSPWFEGYIDYATTGRTVVCTAEVRCIKNEAPASEAEAWNSAIKEIKTASSAPVILVPNKTEINQQL